MDEFFERPVVWFCALCVAVAVLLARCEEREPYDPYAWQGATPEAADAACYEEEMLANSLPPTGNWE